MNKKAALKAAGTLSIVIVLGFATLYLPPLVFFGSLAGAVLGLVWWGLYMSYGGDRR